MVERILDKLDLSFKTVMYNKSNVFMFKKCDISNDIYEVEMTLEQYQNYINGDDNIVTIFPDHSPEQREFIITGFTPEEWNKLFRD